MGLVNFKTIGNKVIGLDSKLVITIQGGSETTLIMLSNGDAYTVYGSEAETKQKVEAANKH